MYKDSNGEFIKRIYTSEWINGQMQLEGKLEMSNGAEIKYFGEINQEFQKHGYGYLFQSNSPLRHLKQATSVYEGYFFEDQR